MAIQHAIWTVNDRPEQLQRCVLSSEALLEQMIVAQPSILSDRWLIIGQQVHTGHGGYVDLLALDQNAHLVVIELKRNQTPREVVAQALDYASWAQNLESDEIARIYDRFSGGKSLDEAFQLFFGVPLDEDQLNEAHQIVVVASVLDPSTERIVSYLNKQDVAINVIFFQVFDCNGQQLLSRAWFIDPVETEVKAAAGVGVNRGEWNGEYYVSFGHSASRDWEEAQKYGFISAGAGAWYSRTLLQLAPGDRVWANVPGQGYVGVGVVTGTAVRAKEFEVQVDGQMRNFLDIAKADYHRDYANDEEKSEYFVPVRWLDTKPVSQAVSETGFFGNQNTVCRPKTPKWDHTVERLKRYFSVAE